MAKFITNNGQFVKDSSTGKFMNEGGTTSYTITINETAGEGWGSDSILYDGTDTSGTILELPSSFASKTYSITSGHLYLETGVHSAPLFGNYPNTWTVNQGSGGSMGYYASVTINSNGSIDLI